MKKCFLILGIFFLFFFSGCEKNTGNTKNTFFLGNDYYTIASPFKSSVGNNYILNNNINTYDIKEVETSLMELSTMYFKTDSSYYQDGQFLTVSDLKTLLSKEKLNNYPEITIDNVLIDPYYVSGLYEQNYLDEKNNLKGISIGIILNPYQKYQNTYGTYLYKEIDEKTLLQIGEEVSQKLLEYLREKEELKTCKILIGLYVQNSPTATMPGSYKKYGITVNKEITFKETSKNYYYLTSSHVLENNNEIYNAFQILQEEIKEILPKTYLIGTAKYQNGSISDITIHITAPYFTKSEILMLCNLVEEGILTNYSNTIHINVYIKENDIIKALLIKEKSEIKIHILEEK